MELSDCEVKDLYHGGGNSLVGWRTLPGSLVPPSWPGLA